MQQPVLLESPQQLARISTVAALPAMDPDVVVRDSPDAHWALIDDDGKIKGRCSLWWHNTPPYYEHRLGVVGTEKCLPTLRDAQRSKNLAIREAAKVAVRSVLARQPEGS